MALDLSAAPTLEAFYRGDRTVMDQCYRQHFADVDQAVARTLSGSDRENVVYEVFYRLVSDEAFRRSFDGARPGAWLAKVASNMAVDALRRSGREVCVAPDEAGRLIDQQSGGVEGQAEARELLLRVRAQVPSKWLPVFEACFVGQLDQRTAAERLGMPRTTFAYQAMRLKWLIERFALEEVRA